MSLMGVLGRRGGKEKGWDRLEEIWEMERPLD